MPTQCVVLGHPRNVHEVLVGGTLHRHEPRREGVGLVLREIHTKGVAKHVIRADSTVSRGGDLS